MDDAPQTQAPVVLEDKGDFSVSFRALAEQLADMTSEFPSSDRIEKESHVPGPLSTSGSDINCVIKHLECLIAAGNEENTVSPITQSQQNPAKRAVTLSHSIQALVAELEPDQLRKLVSRLISDTSMWLIRLFRFYGGAATFHEDSREGLLRLCRILLLSHYPKFSTDGYEALFSRPPVFYISSIAQTGLVQYLAAHLSLPLHCFVNIPCLNNHEFDCRMNLTTLESRIAEDIAAQKIPLMVVASAGNPPSSENDDLQQLMRICHENNLWLHVAGNTLAGLCLTPASVDSSSIADSMDLPIGIWLGMPSLPFVTVYKPQHPVVGSISNFYNSNLQRRLNCLPVWVALQVLGSDGIVGHIRQAFAMMNFLIVCIAQEIPNMFILSFENFEEAQQLQQPFETVDLHTLLTALPASVLMLYTPTGWDRLSEPAKDPNNPVTLNYCKSLNSWLGQVLKRDISDLPMEIVEIVNAGICLRFSPLEAAEGTSMKPVDLKAVCDYLSQQVDILNSTVESRCIFHELVSTNSRLQLLELPQWAGLGGVRYIPDLWKDRLSDLPESVKKEIDNINVEIVQQIKSGDAAFSLGRATGSNDMCIRFGMVTRDAVIEELVQLVVATGQQIEESSKYMEKMADLVRKGIETASEDLRKETEDRFFQEGVLRQVPIVGSFVNWWYPLAKEVGVKGRTFHLASGMIESTENIYKYHMQISHMSKGSHEIPSSNFAPAETHTRESQTNVDTPATDREDSEEMAPEISSNTGVQIQDNVPNDVDSAK